MQPFEDMRSDQERKAYAKEQAVKRKRNESRKQYEKIKVALPNEVPKTFAAFVKMKAAKSERYKELLKDYRTVMGIAKQQESGIIEEKSRKPITKISDNAIESVPKVLIDGYTDEQCIEIQKQHKELLDYSRTHNEDKEVAFVFRRDLADRTEFNGEDDKLDFGAGIIGKGNDLLVMHNHPRNSSYSTTDIDFFGANDNVKTLSIVKNNGKVEILTKGDNFDVSIFKIEYNRLYKKIVKNNTDAEKDKFVKALLSKSKSGVIWIES